MWSSYQFRSSEFLVLFIGTGGSGTNDKGFAYNVSGIGLDKAAAIAYRTLTTYLTSSSTYANTEQYSLQAAADLYGAGSNEVTQVTNAWNAVGVGGGTYLLQDLFCSSRLMNLLILLVQILQQTDYGSIQWKRR